jgi:MFS transporter, AAHS family, 4-hydroxybenzoate transporter
MALAILDGSCGPLIISVFLVTSLPESFRFLINSGAAPEKVRAVLYQFIPGVRTLADAQGFAIESKDGRIAIYDLFKSARGLGTVILWVVFALNLAEFYGLQSWLPTILTDHHCPLSTVALATTLTTIGGIVVAVVIGPAMDRLGAYRSLAVLYLLGVAFVAFMGMAINGPKGVLLTATFFLGVCVSGGQKSVIALAAIFYPPALRSTGVGWALGLGRLGAIGGPFVIGALLGAGVGPSSMFYFTAVPMLVCGLLIALLGLVAKRDDQQRART